MIYNLYDTRNNLYRLKLDEQGKPIVLGSGGQGSVFLVEGNKNIVIKALTDNEGNIVKDNKRYRQYELNMLKVVAVEHINYLARPLIMLQAPYCGYVMLFMHGLEPVVHFLLPQKFTYSFSKAIEDIVHGCHTVLRNYKNEIDEINTKNNEKLNQYLKKIEKIDKDKIDKKRLNKTIEKYAPKEIKLHECFMRISKYEKKLKQYAYIRKHLDGNINSQDSVCLEYFNADAIRYSRNILKALMTIYSKNNTVNDTSVLELKYFYGRVKEELQEKSIIRYFIFNVISNSLKKQKNMKQLINDISEMEIDGLHSVNNLNTDITEHNLWNFILLTGGLKKRYAVLLRIAKLLRNLYNKGLVYGDISPANIFVSEHSKDYEMWLIDTDNLRYASKATYAIGTPTYRAPEIVRDNPDIRNTFYSDWYSFAIFAYEYLTFSKPFMGKDYFNRCEESSWDEGLETENEDVGIVMEKGELAYVDDPKDKSNEKCCGLDIESVMTERVRMLFQAMFSLEGRINPKARPNIVKWCEALEDALLYLKYKKCENNHSFLGTKCPMCSDKLSKKTNKYFKLSAVKYIYESDEEGHYTSLIGKEPFFDMKWSWPKNLADRKKTMKVGLPKKLFEPLSNCNDIVYYLYFDEIGLNIQKAGKEGYTLLKKGKDGQDVDALSDADGFDCIVMDKKADVPIASFLVEEDCYGI